VPIDVKELHLPDFDLAVFTLTRAQMVARIREARAEHPWLARNPLGINITSYEHAVGVLRDRRFHSAVSLIPQMQGLDVQLNDRPSILSTEGDVHDRLRRLVAPAFTPKAADRLRPYMRQVISELVDAALVGDSIDMVADVCEPYPIPVICELLGAPKQDWRMFSAWATDLLRIFNNNLAVDLPVILSARNELTPYIQQLVEEHRQSPREDLLSDLIAIEEAGDRLSTMELVTMAEAVLVAGTDTTRNQLGCIMALFAEHPDQWELLVNDPGLAPRAVEEGMRYLGAIRGTVRVASEDIVYNDVFFAKGTLVFPSFLGANFEADRFPNPDTFDITKEPPRSPHLTFGSGIHHCLGAWLARAELQEALPVLAARLPRLELAHPIEWKSVLIGIWGPEHLVFRAP
jgi:cytochrome P450